MCQQNNPNVNKGTYLVNVMNWGAFSAKALVTLVTHLDIDAWLIPIASPIDDWNDPDV